VDGLRAEAAKHFGKQSADFNHFADYVLGLLASHVKNCQGKVRSRSFNLLWPCCCGGLSGLLLAMCVAM
jgi:hypothetical protein